MGQRLSQDFPNTKWQTGWVSGVLAWYLNRKNHRSLKDTSALMLGIAHKSDSNKKE